MKIVRGNLIDLALAGDFDVIVHGCNLRQTWGAGIALQMKRAFPEAYEADKRQRERDRGLGMISIARVLVERTSLPTLELAIVNAYTQITPGRYDVGGNRGIDLVRNIEKAMVRVRQHFTGKRIGYPRIGAGLAGGNWWTIAEAIDCVLAGEDHTLVEWNSK